MDFLALDKKKILNKVICDFHFKETNFMNYKRERLTKMNSVPTIYIASDKTEIDLIQHPTEWVKANKAKKIPPLFSCSNINLNSSNSASVESLTSSPSPKRIKTEPVRNSNLVSVRILNGSVSANESKDLTVRVVKKKPQPSSSEPSKVIQRSEENYRIQMENKPSSSKSSIAEDIQFTPIEIEPAGILYELNASTSHVQKDKSMNDSSSQDLKPMLLDSLKQISEIKELLNEKQSEAATPSTAAKHEDCSNISRSQYNKVQLFNGIKRYLSPSLIALLRMELFGNPGREYKKDEKIICQELLQFGDKVYNFFTDEWRIRLPAREDVQRWHGEQLIEEDDDAS
jgi:hypothetical protein